MLFSSTIFLFLFLPFTLLLYFISPKKLKNVILLVASLFFYAWGEMQYVIIMILSILINYITGLKIDKHQKAKNKKSSKIALIIGITLNLLLLCYFKYANFLLDNFNIFINYFNLEAIEYKKIHLPIGISFFTFQAISYIADVYRKEVKVQKNFWNLALYISLFPQLIAGPIVRYNSVAKEINNRTHSVDATAEGIRRFIRGLGKKVLLANPMGEIADTVFALSTIELNPIVTWIGIICYSLQIFFDFAGYSDMAIGLGKIFGFNFPENFNFPYIAKSIKEFWRRWHISLSTWLKDYLYVPLGGNKLGATRTYINLLIVFILCGFWHGASWNFIIWGLYQGFFLIIERMKFGKRLEQTSSFFQHFYMIFVILIGWVLFRSETMSQAGIYIANMFAITKSTEIPLDLYMLLNNFSYTCFAFAILLCMPFASWSKNKLTIKINKKYHGAFVLSRDLWLILIMIFSIIRIAAGTHNPFIYFRF